MTSESLHDDIGISRPFLSFPLVQNNNNIESVSQLLLYLLLMNPCWVFYGFYPRQPDFSKQKTKLYHKILPFNFETTKLNAPKSCKRFNVIANFIIFKRGGFVGLDFWVLQSRKFCCLGEKRSTNKSSVPRNLLFSISTYLGSVLIHF